LFIKDKEMRIIFNEKQVETSAGNLNGLLEEMHLSDKTGIAVAVNESVIPRKQWPEKEICENDTILVITAAAGG